MPFDFNQRPLRMYGLFPEAPFALEVSVYGYCRMACAFCFANLNRQANERELHQENTTPALFRKLERAMADEFDPLGWFLREKYPVVFSNATDPFQRDEKTYRSSEAFLSWCQVNGVPVSGQTRGNVLYEEWDRYVNLLDPGRVVVYLSICQQDDEQRRFLEPGALSLPRRWGLARFLSDHNIPVIAACNPYCPEWIPEPEVYCQLAADMGCRGIVVDRLHFSTSQLEVLPRAYQHLPRQANLPEKYLLPLLRRFREAAESRGLLFDATSQWNPKLGLTARHIECANPTWLGGKVFDAPHRILNALQSLADNTLGPVVIGWPEIKEALEALQVPNPTLKTEPFWHSYNTHIRADHRLWKESLGDRATLWEILRHWWNHPYESTGFLWHHPCLHPIWNPVDRLLYTDDAGNVIGCFDPTISERPKDLDHDRIDWNRVSVPVFKEPNHEQVG